jgi:hypothetical protein
MLGHPVAGTPAGVSSFQEEVTMDKQDKIRELTDMIVEDFKSASGFGPENQADSEDSFDLHMDPTPFITMIVSPIVVKIVNMLSKQIEERKPKTPAQLTDQQISEIRKIVVNFSAGTGSSQRRVLKSVEVARMADSVERVLRKNPRVLLG